MTGILPRNGHLQKKLSLAIITLAICKWPFFAIIGGTPHRDGQWTAGDGGT